MRGYILESLMSPPENAFNISLSTRHRAKGIQFKEIKAVLYAIRLWLQQIRGSRLILYCDNEACVYRLQKSSIRGPAMALLRDIAMLFAINDIIVVPTWIRIENNQLADDLSRFRYRKIADTYPQLRMQRMAPQI